MANMFLSKLKAAASLLQSKTITAGTAAQTVQPDSGYDGFSEVTVNPTPSQTKSVTATTSTQTVSPDSGKLLSQVTVNPQSHSGSTSYSTNGQKDLGANHNTRYVNINVSSSLSETTLWSNSNTSSTFSGQTVSLNSSMSNYAYVRFYFDRSTTSGDNASYIIPVSNFQAMNNSNGTFRLCAQFKGSSGVIFSRVVIFSSNTAVQFGNCTDSSTGENTNNTLIPTKITGLL